MISLSTGDYGVCYYQDCIAGMAERKTECDITVTDVPYNNSKQRASGMNDSDSPRAVETYDDNMPEIQYRNFLAAWFEFNKKVSPRIIFTCGKRNMGFWQSYDPIFRDQWAIWNFPNSPSRGFVSQFLKFEPVLFWGDFSDIKKAWDGDVFSYYINNGFMRSEEFGGKFGSLVNPMPNYRLIHQHPKPYLFWHDLIIKYRPKSVFDPFMGSGITARICEMYGIKWASYEINEKYRPDIEWNIAVGKANRKSFEKKKVIVDMFSSFRKLRS